MKTLHRFVVDESGVTAVEYAMIIGSIALAAYMVIRFVGMRASRALIEYLVYEYLW